MAGEKELPTISLLALAGGILSVLAVALLIDKLSFARGVYYGVVGVINAYNISASSSILPLLTQSTKITVGLYFTYLMLPLSVLMFAIATLWMFSKSYFRLTSLVLLLSSFIFALVTVSLEYTLGSTFTSYVIYAIPYIAALASFVAGTYTFVTLTRRTGAVRAAGPISMNPETPYTNIMQLKRLMSRMGGELKILDMHFDTAGLENLNRLLSGNLDRFTNIYVLTRRDRLGSEFLHTYNDYRSELANRNISFELKVLTDEDAAAQHERILMDKSTAYKIPPLNIIHKKSEHIVSIKYRDAYERFARLWQYSTKPENLKPT